MKNDPKKQKRALTDKLNHVTMVRDEWTKKISDSPNQWLDMLLESYNKRIGKLETKLKEIENDRRTSR